jgi:hypothetical protein
MKAKSFSSFFKAFQKAQKLEESKTLNAFDIHEVMKQPIFSRIPWKIVEKKPKWSWDGKIFRFHEEMKEDEITHECFHWLLAPEWRKDIKGFGLGGGFLDVEDFKSYSLDTHAKGEEETVIWMTLIHLIHQEKLKEAGTEAYTTVTTIHDDRKTEYQYLDMVRAYKKILKHESEHV